MPKIIKSPNYNLYFDSKTGLMIRWGKTKEDDPEMCPFGPEIADIEISTVCNGIGRDMASRKPCPWCYKSNTGVGENMSLETFKNVFHRLNAGKTLTQIAFGIGDLDANRDLYDIMLYCRGNGVVPNITTNGMGILEKAYPHNENTTVTHADILAGVCGAVAVSHYGNDDLCFDAVEALSSRGLKQVNIHKLLSEETLQSCFDLIDKAASARYEGGEKRLKGLKAIVFLLLKPKGDRNQLTPIPNLANYSTLLAYAQSNGVAIGFDSCSAPMALKSLPAEVILSVEPCESTLFSIYVNVRGEMFPCSFTEGTPGWEVGIPLGAPPNGEKMEDTWFHPRLAEWRRGLLGSSKGCSSCDVQRHCRSCPVYDVTICQPKPHLQQNESLIQIGRREKRA